MTLLQQRFLSAIAIFDCCHDAFWLYVSSRFQQLLPVPASSCLPCPSCARRWLSICTRVHSNAGQIAIHLNDIESHRRHVQSLSAEPAGHLRRMPLARKLSTGHQTCCPPPPPLSGVPSMLKHILPPRCSCLVERLLAQQQQGMPWTWGSARFATAIKSCHNSGSQDASPAPCRHPAGYCIGPTPCLA